LEIFSETIFSVVFLEGVDKEVVEAEGPVVPVEAISASNSK
jgi:hypothetical protein